VKQLSIKYYVILLLGTVGLITIFPLLNVGLVINDDLQNSIRAYTSNLMDYMKVSFEMWKVQGRPNLFASFSYYIPFIVDNFIFYKIIALGTLITIFILASYLLKILFKDNYLFAFTLLLFLIGMQVSWEHSPVVSFSGFFSIPLIMLISSLILFIQYKKTNMRFAVWASCALYIATLFSYELFILYSPIFFLISYYYDKGQPWSYKTKKMIPIIICVSIYLVLYGIFRFVYGSSYAGAQVESSSLNIWKIVQVIWQLSISSFPGYFSFNGKYQYLLYIYSESKGDPLSIVNIIGSVEIQTIIKVLLTFSLTYSLISRFKLDLSNKKILVISFISLIYVFVPNFLLAITPLYQKAIIENDQLGMPSSFFSFISLILMVSMLTLYITKITSKLRFRYKSIILTSISLFLSLIAGIVDYTNIHIAKYQAMSNEKWKLVNEFLKTDEGKQLQENSVIISPTLWTHIGSAVIHDSYWSDYFKHRTNKNIFVLKDISALGNINVHGNVYFLKYNQTLKDPEQYLIFSELNSSIKDKEIDSFYSNRVTVFSYSKYRSYTLIGALKENNSQLLKVNSVRDIPVREGYFKIGLDNNDIIQIGNLKKIEIKGENIDLDSLILQFDTLNKSRIFN